MAAFVSDRHAVSAVACTGADVNRLLDFDAIFLQIVEGVDVGIAPLCIGHAVKIETVITKQ